MLTDISCCFLLQHVALKRPFGYVDPVVILVTAYKLKTQTQNYEQGIQ